MSRTHAQFTVGVDRRTMARIERIRACTGMSRNKVINEALMDGMGGLDALETEYMEPIKQFSRLAVVPGIAPGGAVFGTWEDLALWYGKEFAGFTYPPSVDVLWEMIHADVVLTADNYRAWLLR